VCVCVWESAKGERRNMNIKMLNKRLNIKLHLKCSNNIKICIYIIYIQGSLLCFVFSSASVRQKQERSVLRCVQIDCGDIKHLHFSFPLTYSLSHQTTHSLARSLACSAAVAAERVHNKLTM
jgi:hypothetical protein